MKDIKLDYEETFVVDGEYQFSEDELEDLLNGNYPVVEFVDEYIDAYNGDGFFKYTLYDDNGDEIKKDEWEEKGCLFGDERDINCDEEFDENSRKIRLHYEEKNVLDDYEDELYDDEFDDLLNGEISMDDFIADLISIPYATCYVKYAIYDEDGEKLKEHECIEV